MPTGIGSLFRSRAGLLRRVAFALPALIVPVLWSNFAAAEPRPLQVELLPGSCPGPALLRDAILPLVPDATVVSTRASDARVVVTDLGERYSITVGSAERTVLDPGRDCLQRARVASVFIAMNLKELEQREPQRATVPASAPPPPRAPAPVTWWTAQAELAGALAPSQAATALGGMLGVGVRRPAWGLSLDAGAFSPSPLRDLGPGGQQSVDLLQLPATLRGSLFADFGAVSLSPSLGVVAEVLRVRGVAVPNPDSATRFEVGALLELATQLSPTWEGFLTTEMRAFPKPYELVVEPNQSLSHTPALWFLSALGIRYDFRSSSVSR